ncbi:hypothetical protein IC007_0726 [Sulfuracidifex tepidarius]|uniref:Uncharacterized protein n=1 Tax=Sulfuracidifex tepidarius TaxID=1294262 RepID=A0A510E148_9CREN|nr:hypothetical protein IC007_0726 [Sulfuracidifex tepidarius]
MIQALPSHIGSLSSSHKVKSVYLKEIESPRTEEGAPVQVREHHVWCKVIAI